MDLLFKLNKLPVLRHMDFPPMLKNVCLLLFQEHLRYAGYIIRARPKTHFEYIVLLDFDDKSSPRQYDYETGGKTAAIPISGPASLIAMPQLNLVYYLPPSWAHGEALANLSRLLSPYGVRNFYIYTEHHEALPFTTMRQPNFFAENHKQLEEIYGNLADDASRETYLAKIKAIVTGITGYLPIASHREYLHPLVKPEDGDIMIDGGVSDLVNAQSDFAAAVGPKGMVYGFEPIPSMYESARQSLSQHENYRLFCQGLGLKKEKLHFEYARDSSRVSAAEANTVECEMINIDSFVEEQGLERFNCIKLDIEGHELAALEGAAKTIKMFRPKLIICLYHKPEDIINIPAYVKSLVSEYELYVSHTSFFYTDTILYARAPC